MGLRQWRVNLAFGIFPEVERVGFSVRRIEVDKDGPDDLLPELPLAELELQVFSRVVGADEHLLREF